MPEAFKKKSETQQQQNDLNRRRYADNYNSSPLPNLGQADNYNQAEKEQEQAKQLKQEQAAARAGNDSGEPDNSNMSLRQRLSTERIKNLAKEKIKQKAKEKISEPAKQGTAYLLKLSWLNLIDSFGLTLIYINMHVFLRWVMPSMFCKLGDEWIPKQASVLGADEAMKKTGQAIGIVEVLGLLLLDLLVLFIVGGAVTWIE